MTDAHRTEISALVKSVVASLGLVGDDNARVIPSMALVERGLHDLNRLADALEKAAAGSIDAAGIRQAVDGLAERAKDVEKRAIQDFAAWLTTRPGVLKVGASYEAVTLFATIDEYLQIKAPVPK